VGPPAPKITPTAQYLYEDSQELEDPQELTTELLNFDPNSQEAMIDFEAVQLNFDSKIKVDDTQCSDPPLPPHSHSVKADFEIYDFKKPIEVLHHHQNAWTKDQEKVPEIKFSVIQL
jgi:hypothetical protein